jgi:hypothetical protein
LFMPLRVEGWSERKWTDGEQIAQSRLSPPAS